MALAASDYANYAQQGLGYTTDLLNYFSNFLTVQAFVGDYGFQRFNTLNAAFKAILTDAQAATPNISDIKNVQVPALSQAVTDLVSYDSNYLTVQTFGGPYMTDRVNSIQTIVTTLLAG
jgi:hypothetical protein